MGKKEAGHELRLLMIDQVMTKSDEIAHDHQLALAIAQVNDEHDLYRRVITLHELFSLYMGMIRVIRPMLTDDMDVNSTNWKNVQEVVKHVLNLKAESLAIVEEAAKVLTRISTS